MHFLALHTLLKLSTNIGGQNVYKMCSLASSIITNARIDTLIDCNKIWQDMSSKKATREMQILKRLNKNDDINTVDEIGTMYNKLLPQMTYTHLLEVLSVLYIKQPGNVKKIQFYKNAMNMLKVGLLQDKLTAKEILAYLFFLLLKGSKTDLTNLLLQYLPDCKKLSIPELSVLAEAIFRCTMPMPSNYCDLIEGLLETESDYLVNNQVEVIPLCKILRFTKVSEDLDLTNLSAALLHKQTEYKLSSIAHILQFYAVARTCHPTVIESLLEEVDSLIVAFLENNMTSSLAKRIMYTPKYLDNMVWAISTLNYEVKCNLLANQIAYFYSIINFYKKKPPILVNTILCYWMLDIKLEKVAEMGIKENIFSNVLKSRNWKEITRLNLLLTCIKLEAPHIIIPKNLKNQINVKSVTLQTRETVQQAFIGIMAVNRKFRLEDIVINCPIEAMFIAGISFKHPIIGYVHIDVLDEVTTVKHTNVLNGLLRLKLRLLRIQKYKSILVHKETLRTAKTTSEYIIKAIEELQGSK